MRQKIDILDQQNLVERKEIEYHDSVLKDKKSESNQNQLELSRLRSIDSKLTEHNQAQTDTNTKLKADSKSADQAVTSAYDKINNAETKTSDEMSKGSKFTKEKLEYKTKKVKLEKELEELTK